MFRFFGVSCESLACLESVSVLAGPPIADELQEVAHFLTLDALHDLISPHHDAVPWPEIVLV